MANKKKRAPWGSKKRAAEAAAAAADGLVEAVEAEAAAATNGNGQVAPSVGDAIENVKNWLAPFDVPTRKQIMKSVSIFLK